MTDDRSDPNADRPDIGYQLRSYLTSVQGALGLLRSGKLDPDSDRGRRLMEIAQTNADELVRLTQSLEEQSEAEESALKIATKLLKTVAAVERKQATGILILERDRRQWKLGFYRGKLACAIGEPHRVRRWYRAIPKNCRDLKAEGTEKSDFWEISILDRALAQQRLESDRAKLAVRWIAMEVLFAACWHPDTTAQWQPHPLKAQLPPEALLSGAEVKALLLEVRQLQQQWRSLKLPPQQVDRAPSVAASADKNANARDLSNLKSMFDGRLTFWDLSLKWKQSPLKMMRLFDRFRRQAPIEWRDVPDLSVPRAIVPKLKPDGSRLRVACIDDSPQICRSMQQIFEGAGYEFIGLQDPVRAIPALIERPPDFIFLDLVMPIANGYEVCSQLRRVNTFREVPIAFLTGNDKLVDRLRAKVVGANDFLSKPVEAQKVLELVRKYTTSEKKPQSLQSN